MSLFNVTFCRYDEYQVEANSESEAIDMAYAEFCQECVSSVASTSYDSVEVEELEAEDAEEETCA